jgi:eukaryotic-like serine/threonine-protein kinase
VSSEIPPPVPAGDSEPGPAPSLPGVALWSDSDPPPGPSVPAAAFTGLVASPPSGVIPTIGHIGRYALKYQLGEGGLGTVFAAHDPLLSRLIAVKTLNVEVAEEERASFNALFLNEARAAGGLSHPHIVTVFDAGISDQRAYIAMELLKGRDLRQLRQEGWRATPAQAALIVRRVADALAFAHSKGVIHRDIKPANIFMVGRTQPRVLDFGIARIAHKQDGGDPHSGAGSPYYMAPEQMRREPADRRADVFSLGVVLYELLTDTKPFRGESLNEIRDAVLAHEPPLASKVDPAVPKALALIAARAMAKDPEQRFRSARSFARELRQWLDDNPVAPDGETLAPVAPRSRKKLAIVAGGVAALAVAIAGAWAAFGSLSSGASAVAATAEARPSATRPEAAPGAAPGDGAATPASPVVAAPVVADALLPVPAVTPAVTPAATPTATPATRPAATPIDPLVAATLGLPAEPPAAAPLSPRSAAPTASPPAAQPRESAKDRRAREAREREARDNEAKAAAARLLAPPTGTVKIAISPWGLVEVDGAASGAAPPITELTLREGKHQIVVRNGDFAPYTASINVTAGQTVSLRYKFGS